MKNINEYMTHESKIIAITIYYKLILQQRHTKPQFNLPSTTYSKTNRKQRVKVSIHRKRGCGMCPTLISSFCFHYN